PRLPPHPYPSATNPLSLHDALPIYPSLLKPPRQVRLHRFAQRLTGVHQKVVAPILLAARLQVVEVFLDGPQVRRPDQKYLNDLRSEEHTSELQSRVDLVCRLLL